MTPRGLAVVFVVGLALLALAGCPEPGPTVAHTLPETPAPTSDTGLDPALAVTGVTVAQDGAEVVLTLEAPPQEPRTTRVSVTWLVSGMAWTEDVEVGADGRAVVRHFLATPCQTLDTGAYVPLAVDVDGATYALQALLEGTVYDDALTTTPDDGLAAICGIGPNTLTAAPGAYEVTSPLAHLERVDDDDATGPFDVEGQEVMELDGTYTIRWEKQALAFDYWLLIRPVPIEPRRNP